MAFVTALLKKKKCENLDNNMKILFFKDTNFQNIVNSTDYVDIGMHKQCSSYWCKKSTR